MRLLKNINIQNTILVDNNIYLFTSQLSKGILINSFYYVKDDKELGKVYRYVIDHILSEDNVRKVNI